MAEGRIGQPSEAQRGGGDNKSGIHRGEVFIDTVGRNICGSYQVRYSRTEFEREMVYAAGMGICMADSKAKPQEAYDRRYPGCYGRERRCRSM